MSISEDDRSFSAEWEALVEAEAETNAYCGLSKEVLETMSNYSPSSDGRVPSNVDPCEWYGITPPGSPTSHMPPSFKLRSVMNKPRSKNYKIIMKRCKCNLWLQRGRMKRFITELLSFRLPMLWYV